MPTEYDAEQQQIENLSVQEQKKYYEQWLQTYKEKTPQHVKYCFNYAKHFATLP